MSVKIDKRYRKELRKVATEKADTEFNKLINELNTLVFRVTKKKNIIFLIAFFELLAIVGLVFWCFLS